MAVDVYAAVSAVIAGDRAQFDRSRAGLDRQDPEQLQVLLGAMARDLVERTYPDGLDSDDAEQVVARCLHSATVAYPNAHRDGFAVALTGALGVSEPDQAVPFDHADVRAHGLLLIADLLGERLVALPAVLDAALRETRRAQTMELP